MVVVAAAAAAAAAVVVVVVVWNRGLGEGGAPVWESRK